MSTMPAPSPESTAPSEPILLREDRGPVAVLTLNRPRTMNTLSMAMLEALQEALDTIAADRSVRALVIAAAGKGFCAGHDLKEMTAHRADEEALQ